MTISPATMTALALAFVVGTVLPAAAQSDRQHAHAPGHATHHKKSVRNAPAASTATQNRPSDSQRWMDRASESSSGGGGGGGGY